MCKQATLGRNELHRTYLTFGIAVAVPHKGKGKGKGHPRTGYEGSEGEQMYSSTLTSTSALD
jgi:hypothetical protein